MDAAAADGVPAGASANGELEVGVTSSPDSHPMPGDSSGDMSASRGWTCNQQGLSLWKLSYRSICAWAWRQFAHLGGRTDVTNQDRLRSSIGIVANDRRPHQRWSRRWV